MDSVTFYMGNKPRKMKRPAPSFMIEQGDLKREMLKHLLEKKKASTSTLSVHFDCEVQDLFLHNNTLVTKTSGRAAENFNFERVVAADGSRSCIRDMLDRQDPHFAFESKHVPGGYKNFFLHRNRNQQQAIDPESIHGWMAGTQTFLQVPLHEDYSSGVYAFTEDSDPLDTCTTAKEVLVYLETKIPSLAAFVSEPEAAVLLEQSASGLCTVRCNSLTAGDHNQAVLLGDAAHTFSASLNQGCNAALQDVQVLKCCLEAEENDWMRALMAYNSERMIDVEAAHELSDYCLPRTKWQRIQFMGRMIGRKLGLSLKLPERLLPPPFPMELLYNETFTYSEILDSCQGWIRKVKGPGNPKGGEEGRNNAPEKNPRGCESTSPNAGKFKRLLVR